MNGNTEVIASVKGELAAPSAEMPGTGTLECSVECWTSASPLYAGRAAAEINSELTTAVTRYVRCARESNLMPCSRHYVAASETAPTSNIQYAGVVALFLCLRG